jgi:hypothetical protein
MSARAMAWAWRQAPKCPNQGSHLVLLALAEYANPEGECFPNRKTVAWMAGFSDKGTVTRNINRLIELGLLVKDSRFDAKHEGRQTSNSYRLLIDAATPPLVPGGQPPPVASAATPGNNSTSKQKQEQTDCSADVQKVWDHFLSVFKPARTGQLGPSRIRQIETALKEAPAADLCLAIDGLYEWRKRKPGDRTLSAIFKTYPGGNPLADQIAFFIGQAKGSTGVGGKFPSADRAIVAEKQRHVQRGHRLTDNAEAVEQAKDAEQWLREHGIETVKAEGDVSFRPLEEGSASA